MSLMNVGVSALTANQQALTVTGHNISNVNTPGYSRQTLNMTAQAGQNTGSGYIGRGVLTNSVVRQFDELLNKQANAATAASKADSARYNLLNQMQDVFTGGDSGLGAAINNMMNAFTDVQAAPTDATARGVVLTRMSELAARFRAASSSLDELDYSAKQQINNGIATINSLTQQVANLNIQISHALATGHTPNDLLDARDTAISKINQYVQTTQIKNNDGTVNLFIGNSQALVLGQEVASLTLKETKEYPGSQKMALYFTQPGGNPVEISTTMVAGGEIAGLLKFINEDLALGKNSLGRLAMALGTELNEQNSLGLTLQGQPGTELFAFSESTPGYSDIKTYKMDPPSATVKMDPAQDAKMLVASDYRIVFGDDASSSQLIRISDGVTRKLSDLNFTEDSATGVTTIQADGLLFTLSEDAIGQKSQSILFQPYSKAANELQAVIHNPNDLAVASMLSASISTSNLGTLQLTQLATRDAADIPSAGDPVVLRFNEDGSISYARQSDIGQASFDWSAAELVKDKNSQTLTYQSGMPFDVDGWTITLTGTPGKDANGVGTDTVTVGNAKDIGEGFKLNAGNAVAFLALRDKALFDNGTTLSDGFSSVMASIGARAQSARYSAELSASVAANLEADRSAVSGVNLDEEAARLLQYQQAYQASAKIIQAAQTLFDSVLNAVGR